MFKATSCRAEGPSWDDGEWWQTELRGNRLSGKAALLKSRRSKRNTVPPFNDGESRGLQQGQHLPASCWVTRESPDRESRGNLCPGSTARGTFRPRTSGGSLPQKRADAFSWGQDLVLPSSDSACPVKAALTALGKCSRAPRRSHAAAQRDGLRASFKLQGPFSLPGKRRLSSSPAPS